MPTNEDDKDIIPSTRGLDIELEVANTKIEVSTTKSPIDTPAPVAKPVEPPKPIAPIPTMWKEGDPVRISKILDSGPGWLKVSSEHGSFKLHGGTISWRNNNPGNIVYGTFAAANKSVGKDYKHFAVFPTYEDGHNAQKELLFSPDSVYYNLSLLDAVRRYAPSDDGNNPKEYANFVSRKAGVDKDTPLYKLTSDQQDAVILAMRQMEGFKQGTIEKL